MLTEPHATRAIVAYHRLLRDQVRRAGFDLAHAADRSRLAEDLGVTPSFVAQVVEGVTPSSWPFIERLLRRCGVTRTWTWQRAWENAYQCQDRVSDTARRMDRVLLGPPPDPRPAETPHQYLDFMRLLLAWAGLSQREAVRRSDGGLGRTALAGLLQQNTRLPSPALLAAFTYACGLTQRESTDWELTRVKVHGRRLGLTTP